LVVILDCTTYAFNITLYIICLLSTGVDAFEGMFGFSDSHEYLYTESSVHSSYSRSPGIIVSILQVQPSESQHTVIDGSMTEQPKLMEWWLNMIYSWRDWIAVIFSQQNDNFQPLLCDQKYKLNQRLL